MKGWPIFGFVGSGDSHDSPGHVVVQNPKNKAYVDIEGAGAAKRWRRKWGAIEIHPLKPEEIYYFDTYFPPDVKKALPFAKRVLQEMGIH